MQISNYLATLNLTQSTNFYPQTQISQSANSFENEFTKANLAQQNVTPNAQIQNENATNSQQKSEFENVISDFLLGLESEGKIEELKNVFSFITSAVAIFKLREQKDRVELSDLPAILAILKEPYTLQAGTYLGQPETQEHFRARKNQAIEALSEFLAQKGLLASKDEPVSAPQKISVDMYYELKFKPKDDEELEKLLQELHNAREDLKKESLPVYQNATNEKSANSPLKDLLQSESVSQTKTLSNLDLSSENFFEDLVNAYYKETGDMLESMQFMVVEKFLALAKRGMQARGADDIAKGFEFGLKQWQETPKNTATNKALLNEMLAIAEREPILYSNNPKLDEHRARAKAFAKEVLALFDERI